MAEEAIFGTIGQIAATALNNQMAAERAQEDRKENYLYGEKAAQNADARTRALYKDFYSPAALLKQYQEAGLSPSMMFDGTPGQGGMSGAQGSGSGNLQTPFMPYSMVEAAQAQALLAQARKTNIEGDTLEGKNERGFAELSQMWANVGNTEASTALINAQTAYQEIQNYITDETKDITIETIDKNYQLLEQQTNQAVWAALREKQAYEFELDTWDDRAKLVSEQYANLAQDTLLKKAQTDLSYKQGRKLEQEILNLKQQVRESVARIAQGWKKLALEGKSIEVQQKWYDNQVKLEQQKINNDWEKTVRSLDIEDEKVRQGYVGLGINVFENTVKIGTQAIMLKGLKSKGSSYTWTTTTAGYPGKR